MARIQVRHLRRKGRGYYFEPSASMRRAGFKPEPLGPDAAKAHARCDELNAQWDIIRAGNDVVPTVRRDTVRWLADEWRTSSDYRDFTAASQKQVDYVLKIVLPVFGQSMIAAVKPEHAKKFYTALRQTGSIHRAAKVLKWSRHLFKLAVDLDKITKNPFSTVRVKQPRSRHQKWKPGQVADVVAEARRQGRSCIAAAVLIAYDTAMRPGDILALRRDNYDGTSLFIRQAKTGNSLHAHLGPEAVAAIESELGRWPAGLPSAPIIRGPHGRRYRSADFTSRFRNICNDARIPAALQFRDIRRTVASELADAGATASQIASTTGHTIGRCAAVLDVYARTSVVQSKAGFDKRQKNISRPKVGK